MELLLDIYILSLIERCLETVYDLHVHGKISLGSSIPAVKRLEAAGFIELKAVVDGGRKRRQAYRITPSGKKIVLTETPGLLIEEPPSDIDSILRILDICRTKRIPESSIAEFLGRALSGRARRVKIILTDDLTNLGELEYIASRRNWELMKLRAEIKFLTQLVKALP